MPKQNTSTLTTTQKVAYAYYLEGKTYKEIAECMHIKDSTLQQHMTAVFHKGFKKRDKIKILSDTDRLRFIYHRWFIDVRKSYEEFRNYIDAEMENTKYDISHNRP